MMPSSSNAYFAMGNKADEETAAYAEAERIRKQLVTSAESQASRLMTKMQQRVKDKPLTAGSLAIELSADKPGLKSARVFDTIEEIAEEAERIAELMLKWRSSEQLRRLGRHSLQSYAAVIDILGTKLADDEISAEEYQKNAEKQEQVNVYLEFLAVLQCVIRRGVLCPS